MNTGDRENEEDRAIIVDNEVIENPVVQNDFQGVISNPKPRRYFIEPAVFLLFAGSSLFETIVPNTVELQYCRTMLNLTEEQCFSPTIDLKVKDEYEKFASTFGIYRSIIEVAIPSFISFFVGPWSDTYGRKPLILSSLLGYSATYGLWTFASSIPTFHPLYFLFFSLPLAFSGGSTTFILGSFCYVCDVTTLENRGYRLGRLQGALFLGALGGMQSYLLLKPFGYTMIYGVSSVFVYLSLFYIYFFLDESIIPSQVELNSPKRNPFHLNHILELYECCYKRQTPKMRITLFLLTLILACSLVNVFGETNVLYYFLQRVLSWDLTQYTYLSSFIIIANAIGAAGGTWLLCRVLQLDDLLILSIAAFFRVLSALVMIFGFRVWHIYFSKLLSCTLGISGSIIRSFLSRNVGKDELGKVFSLLASTESTTPMFANLLYSTVFNLTIETMPGAIFYVSGFLILFMLGCLAILVKMYIPDPTKRSLAVTQDTPSINAN